MAVSTVALRAATRLDEPHVRQAFLESGWSSRRYRDHTADLRARHPGARTYILLDAGAPAGAIIVDRSGGRLHIVALAVRAAGRRRGIASSALRELLRPGDHATVLVEAADTVRRSFFERHGFETVAEQLGLLLMATGADG
jgi:ribosomal protein S18 acetylase RimI-like enzyme